MRVALSCTAVFVLFALSVARTALADVCDGSDFVATVTYTGGTDVNCTYLNASCWSPHLPGLTDSVRIPSGSIFSVNNSNGTDFVLFAVANLHVEAGATILMSGRSFQISECLINEGNITMTGDGGAVQPMTMYLRDPNQPEGTDCALLPVGFNPRICGPGLMRVKKGGQVTLGNYYASVFITTIVDKEGSFSCLPYSFMWANLTNYGTFLATGWVYIHGFFFNHGQAQVGALVFDKWAKQFIESPPILFENHGYLNFTDYVTGTWAWYGNSTTGNGGVYRAAVVNYGVVTYTLSAAFATQSFDLFNFGRVKWGANTWYSSWTGQGNFVNHGTFEADQYSVYLANYYSVGGTLDTKNSGSFTMGNGGVDPKTIKLCTLSPVQIKAIQYKNIERKRLPPVLIRQRDGCWWYGQFCYQTPYLVSPPQLELEEPPAKQSIIPKGSELKKSAGKNVVAGVAIALVKIIQSVNVPTACTERYSFTGKSKIIGDGTGSVVTTLPVHVVDSIEVRHGGRWYAMTENGNPPVFGGGAVRIREKGELFLALDMDLSLAGSIEVEAGGTMAIPKHAKVRVSNHTIKIHPNGVFYVDGLLSTVTGNIPMKNCGKLEGNGKINKGNEEDLHC
jgi:hypothetical protein